jgi:hypothetical protein
MLVLTHLRDWSFAKCEREVRRSSVFIPKGKRARPTEFGQLVGVQEAEVLFIHDYAVCEHGHAERALRETTLDRHRALFERAPQLPSPTAGFPSRTNERAAQDRGVRHVVLVSGSERSFLGLRARCSAGGAGAKDGAARASSVMGSAAADTAARAGYSACVIANDLLLLGRPATNRLGAQLPDIGAVGEEMQE